MSIKIDLCHFLCCCLMYHFKLIKKGFTHWIILSFLLWYHRWVYFCMSSTAQGSFPTAQRCPGWKQKRLKVKGTYACVAGSKGLEAKRGSLFKGIKYIKGGKLVNVKAFLVIFSHTDMSNKRSLLSNIAYLNSWHKEELLVSSVWSSSVISWAWLYQHNWRLIPPACCRLRREVRISRLALQRVFLVVCSQSLFILFTKLNVRILASLEVAPVIQCIHFQGSIASLSHNHWGRSQENVVMWGRLMTPQVVCSAGSWWRTHSNQQHSDLRRLIRVKNLPLIQWFK